MRYEPSEEELDEIPKFYATREVPYEHTKLHMHFNLGSFDWYAAEYNPAVERFYGMVTLDQDFNSERWGYINYPMLRDLKTKSGLEVERDVHWKPQTANRLLRRY